MAKKPETKMDASLVEKVLDAVSRERRAAHEDLDAANDNLSIAAKKENATVAPLAKAFTEAKRAIDAHARYKTHGMPLHAWDEKQRVLQRALDDAVAEKDAAIEAAERRLAPLRRKANTLTERCLALAEEWEDHRRTAEAAHIDLKRYWTPESGEPAAA